MPKYYRKPKGVDAYSAAVDGTPPTWVQDLIAAGRLVPAEGGSTLAMGGGVNYPVLPTDYLVLDLDTGAIDVLPPTAFEAHYEKDTRAET